MEQVYTMTDQFKKMPPVWGWASFKLQNTKDTLKIKFHQISRGLSMRIWIPGISEGW